MSTTKWKCRLIARTVGSISIALAITLLLTELFLRIFIILPSATVSDPKLGWRYAPNATILHSEEGYARNRLNSLGHNDKENPNPEATRRIVAIGDSYTAALHVSQEDNFTSVVELTSPCADVLNAGRAGTTVVHYPVVISRLVESYPFDEIVVIVSSGDLAEINSTNFEIKRASELGEIQEIMLKDRQMSQMRQVFDPIFSRSSLATFLKNRIKQLILASSTKIERSGQTTSQKYDDQEIAEIFQFALTEINAMAPTSVLYIPNLQYMSHGQSRETSGSRRTWSLIKSVAEEIDLPFVRVDGLADVYRLGGNPPNGFANKDISSGHLNQLGHAITAKSIVELLNLSCAK